MLTRTFSATLSGVDARTIEVEVNATGQGEESNVVIVGLPDAAVRESRNRVSSALQSSGYGHPSGYTLVNLAPADIRKEGAAFDLPIALAFLSALGLVNREELEHSLIVGELALDGSVRPVKGCLPMAMLARDLAPGIRNLIVPEKNAQEAVIAAKNMRVFAVSNLREAADAIAGGILPLAPAKIDLFQEPDWSIYPDFADVKGQYMAKRALEIAAAGGHNVLFIGPPGTGKSMLASRLPGILPPMTEKESLETSRVYSVSGLLSSDSPLLKTRPFRSPHHTVSDAGLLGGGTDPRPGEISLAHNGVLFLDELPEFKRSVLETLRQPMETGVITISRAAGSFDFPCRFLFLAAMNPCPCGHFGDPRRNCRCGAKRIQDYRAKISGPLLDRIDLHVEVASLTDHELLNAPVSEPSSAIRERVFRARMIQNERGVINSQLGPKHLREFCQIAMADKNKLRHMINELALSARAYDRILRVARTIADLDGLPEISMEHIYEAVGYRSLDRRM